MNTACSSLGFIQRTVAGAARHGVVLRRILVTAAFRETLIAEIREADTEAFPHAGTPDDLVICGLPVALADADLLEDGCEIAIECAPITLYEGP